MVDINHVHDGDDEVPRISAREAERKKHGDFHPRKENTNHPGGVIGIDQTFPKDHDNRQDQCFAHFFQKDVPITDVDRWSHKELGIFRTVRTFNNKQVDDYSREEKNG